MLGAPAICRRAQRFLLCVIVLATIGIIVSLYFFAFWLVNNYITNRNTSEVVDDANLTTVTSNSSTPENNSSDSNNEFNPYWNFSDTDYLAADFNQLRQLNPEIIAWISVGGTNINYPVAQHTDNVFYLNHSVDRSRNDAGWVFMDYRNHGLGESTTKSSTTASEAEKVDPSTITYDRNTIIYAHNRHDGSMFGTLKYTLGDKWRYNPDNFLIRISTPHTNSIWQIFSTYQTPDTNDYIQTDFASNSEYTDFLNLLRSRSNFDFRTELGSNDKILTLSTCAGSTSSDKIVVHAKLIRSQKR